MNKIEQMLIANFKGPEGSGITSIQEMVLDHLYNCINGNFPGLDGFQGAAIRTTVLRTLYRASEKLNKENGYVFDEVFEEKGHAEKA